jgi:Brp/Blh family beta-carotene 15,15'-monooxygenase
VLCLVPHTTDGESFDKFMKLSTALVVTLLALLLGISAIDPILSDWMAVLTIIVAGVPHGAFDLRLARAIRLSGARSTLFVVSAYVLSALTMSALCILLPAVGFSLFIAISIIHFAHGEKLRNKLLSFQVGLAAVCLPIGLHYDAAKELMIYFLSRPTLDFLEPFIRNFAVVLTISLSLSLSRYLPRSNQNGIARSDLIEIVFCLAGWVLLPPLAAFCIWFIGRHSLGHILFCKQLLKGDHHGQRNDFILISTAALALFIPLSFLFDLTDLEQLFSAGIVLIAGLTLPHIIIVHNGPHPHSHY